MNYSDNPGHVRVDRFNPRGKWYDTLVIDMSEFYNEPFVWTAIEKAFKKSHPELRFDEHFTIVCLEPYHKYSYPFMFKSKELIVKEDDVILSEM